LNQDSNPGPSAVQASIVTHHAQHGSATKVDGGGSRNLQAKFIGKTRHKKSLYYSISCMKHEAPTEDIAVAGQSGHTLKNVAVVKELTPS